MNIKIALPDYNSINLFKAWKLNPDDREFTIMRIVLQGEEKGVKKEIVYNLYDVYDPKNIINGSYNRFYCYGNGRYDLK